ncbi:MAG: RagB/SusD family nutrient uptake outer membrane protein [Reichenbachiella sp.]
MKYIYIVFVLAGLCACSEDFLDERPKGVVGLDQLSSTEDGINQLLVGAYAILSGFEGQVGEKPGVDNVGVASNPHNWVFADIPSDDAHKGDVEGGWAEIGLLEKYVADPTNVVFERTWGVNYDGVFRANNTIKAITRARESGVLTVEKADQLEAEARFLRAWFHFQLRMKFERIPYIYDTEAYPETVKNDREIYDDIEADLQWGLDHDMVKDFNDNDAYNQGEIARATYWAAAALKAKAHMYQGEYVEAGPVLDEIINDGGFALTDHFYDNFDEEQENNEESIFEIQFSILDGTNGNQNATIGTGLMAPSGTGYAWGAVSFDLFNAFRVDGNGLPLLDTFQDNLLIEDYGVGFDAPFVPTTEVLDPRADWTLMRRNIPYLDWGPFTGSDRINDQNNMGPFLNKKIMFYQRNLGTLAIQSWNTPTSNNYRAIRYSHILLWRAEVAVEANELQLAADLVDEIRTRASNNVVMGFVTTSDNTFGSNAVITVDESLPAANYDVQEYGSFPSQAYARKAVRHETRMEFALEGHRFYDLVRWGVAASTLNKYLDSELSNNKLPWLQGIQFTENKNEYYPLPQAEINIQKGVLVQDPNY